MIEDLKSMFTEKLVPTIIVLVAGVVVGVFASKPIKKLLHLK